MKEDFELELLQILESFKLYYKEQFTKQIVEHYFEKVLERIKNDECY